MGRAELFGPFELPGIDIDPDDGGGAGELGAHNDRLAHAAATDDGNRLARLDLAE